MSDDVKEFVQQLRIQNAKLQDILTHGSENFRRYRRRAYVAFAGLAVVSAVALYLVSQTGERIQMERARSIRTTCQEQNDRHRQTIARLDQGIRIARKVASPARIKRLRESRAFTVRLIDALVPVRDCDELVTRSVDAGIE